MGKRLQCVQQLVLLGSLGLSVLKMNQEMLLLNTVLFEVKLFETLMDKILASSSTKV